MKKLLNQLAVIAMMLCLALTASAQPGRVNQPAKKPAATQQKKATPATPAKKPAAQQKPAVKPTPKPVDMGLSVKWADIDFDAPSAKAAGPLFPTDEQEATNAKMSEGWRIPTKEEMEELLGNSEINIKLTNNIPTSVVLTSKKNGAQLTLPVPKKVMTADMLSEKDSYNPNKAKNGSSLYYIYLQVEHSEYNYCMIKMVSLKQTLPDLYNQMQGVLKKGGLQGKKVSEWPDEVRYQMIRGLNSEWFIASDYLDWIGIGQIGHLKSGINASIPVRPVFEMNDED